MKCNTMRRWSTNCVEAQWGKKAAEEYDYFTFRSNYYSQIQQIDDCAMQIIYPSYSLEVSEFEDKSMWLCIGLSILGTTF